MKKREKLDKKFGRRRGERSGRSRKHAASEKKLASRAMRRERKRLPVDEQGTIERQPRRGWEV